MTPTRIATLIVGTVTALGIMFAFWGAQLVQTNLNETASSEELCLGAMLSLYSGRYDSETQELFLVFENQRGADLELKALYLFYPDKEMKTFELNEGLGANMLLSIPVKGVEDGFESGTIKTNCPDANVDFSYSDVT